MTTVDISVDITDGVGTFNRSTFVLFLSALLAAKLVF